MARLFMAAFVLVAFLTTWASGQQAYRLPNVKTMKHLTTRDSEHARDIPGKETVMDFYSAGSGQMVTVYSYNNRPVAFSTHKNSDLEGTYRLFLDMNGDGLFQPAASSKWQIPAWAR
jgi:hypothetical protein